MKRLLEQLDLIQAIVDTVSPSQIERDPQGVTSRYELYASTYDPIERVKTLRDRLIAEIRKGKPVNGYLSADYGYGKTATLIYLWNECRQNQIVAVPPFKFKELGDLMVATYGCIKASLVERVGQSKLLTEFETLYREYGLKSQQEQAAEIARKYKLSEDKALHIVRELKTETAKTDSVLNFWQESVPIIRKGGFAGLAIFADELQEFLRTEEGASARIQILSDLVKGMRALGSAPVALILSMPTVPTESAIAEQAGDIIHRMQEMKVSLRLADAYNSEFPRKLWDSLCEKFLEDKSAGKKLASPATIESLGQLCDRKDLSNGPRTVIEVFKRIVRFVREKEGPYSPLDLIEDYLAGDVQLYGTHQHQISDAIKSLEPSISWPDHPEGRKVVKLLAGFPAGVSEAVAEELGLLKSLKKMAQDENFYGPHIMQLTRDRYALVALMRKNTATAVDKILTQFRKHWFGDWNDAQKQERAAKIFMAEIIPLLFPASKAGQKANWTWRYKGEWKQDRFGFYNFLSGAPEKYHAEFANRSLVISVGSDPDLMQFNPPEETHLDWRFYLSYERDASANKQRLTAIAGTGQVDFHIQLGRTFERDYPTVFGLLNKVIPFEKCSACLLLNLSDYIRDWLLKNPEVSKADRDRLEHHRQECHRYAMQLLLPAIQPETWQVEGLKNVNGAETKVIESVFYQKCKFLFPEYKAFSSHLRPTLQKYKSVLENVSLAVRRGRQLQELPKEDFEKLFDAAGSGLPSILAIFKQCGLIAEYKVAGNKAENSQVALSEHPLESFIQKQLSLKGRTQGKQDVKTLACSELWKEVKRLGYLQEELEEALEWVQRRRHIEWDRQRQTIRQAVALDPDDLNSQLNEIRIQIASLLQVFDETLLHEVAQSRDEAQQTLEANRDDEVALDQVQRQIQAISQRLEKFRSIKRSVLEKELEGIKFKLKNLTADLNASKVSEPIPGNSSNLEACIEKYRNQLEKQVERLDRDCQSLADSIRADEPELRELFRQKEHCNQFWQNYENTKKRLQPLAAGLEQWRIIITRAGTLRETVANDPERSQRYEDDFIDRVVEHFDTHQIESFGEYEQLQLPLLEIEEQIKRERRVRREAFEQLLSSYETLLARIASSESSLRHICRFDDDDRKGSYATVRQIFLEKVQNWRDRVQSDWEKVERELYFIARERERDVRDLLNQLSQLKNDLASRINEVVALKEDAQALEDKILRLQELAEKGQDIAEQSLKLMWYKNEDLAPEERQLLEEIKSLSKGTTIGQLCRHTSQTQDFWDLVKSLYRKGHLDIALYWRE